MTTSLRGRVNKTSVDALAPGQTIRDDQLPGFGARRQRGKPIYFLQRRISGRIRWLTIGTHGAPWTAETARKEAYRLLGAIAGGDNPAVERQQRLENPTLAQAIDLFREQHMPGLKPATATRYDVLFRLHIVPLLGTYKVADIARADIQRLQRKLGDIEASANYAVAVMSKLMNWCEEQGFRPDQSNPCRRVKKFKATKRERFLSREELGSLAQVLRDLETSSAESPYVIAAIRLLIFTGARMGEILTLRWSYVDFDRGFLALPDSKTGQKQVALNRQALEVLTALPRVKNNPFVIVGRNEGQRLINLEKPWRRIRAAAGIPDVRIHDLRHSFASVAADTGGSLRMIGKLLGHSQPQTTDRYAHLTDSPVRQLNDKIGSSLAEAMGMKTWKLADRLLKRPLRQRGRIGALSK